MRKFKESLFRRLNIRSKNLFVYEIIFGICFLLILINLYINKIGLNVLSNGSVDEKCLMLLSLVIMIFCIMAISLMQLAINKKKSINRKVK